jgi:hypothetical protein
MKNGNTISSTILFLLACLALSPGTQAVSPAPDGGYPGGNTAEGQSALLSRTTGGFNTAVGFLSLRSDTTNSFNTAIGAGALLANTADNNTATGAGALLSNTTGSVNTAYGAFALFHNTTGGGHTAVGYNALAATNASDFLEGNTAVGSSALAADTTGNANTAVGFGALFSNITGNSDTAIGNLALGGNTTGNYNTASGATTLSNNNGDYNAAYGDEALYANTTGGYNTAMGIGALLNNTTGNNNTALGANSGPAVTTAANVIVIGSLNAANVDNSCWIGNIYGTTTQSGTTLPVIVSDTGQLGTTSSSRRDKKDIATMDTASEAILLLRPVTFHYKSDTKRVPQFGLIAEEVAEVNPDLVARDKDGKPYTVRYDQVNAMLLNEFLKEHRKVEQLEKQVEKLTVGLQKVSAQIEMSRAAPQTVCLPAAALREGGNNQ